MELKFRKIKDQDLEMIRAWRQSPEVTKYMYTDPEISSEDQKKWFSRIKEDPSALYWIIHVDGEDAGLLSLTEIDRTHRRCTWAYYISSTNMRGKGIGRSVELSVLEYVFDELKLEKLCCEVFEFNEKVIEIHKKYGSKIEGLRRNHIYKKGEPYNIVEMAILKSEFDETIRGKFEFVKGQFE